VLRQLKQKAVNSPDRLRETIRGFSDEDWEDEEKVDAVMSSSPHALYLLLREQSQLNGQLQRELQELKGNIANRIPVELRKALLSESRENLQFELKGLSSYSRELSQQLTDGQHRL
jgi:hypothetical protein